METDIKGDNQSMACLLRLVPSLRYEIKDK